MRAKTIIAFAITLLSFGSLYAEGTWHNDLDEALDVARDEGKPVLMDVMAVWCGYCRAMQRDVYPSQVVRAQSSKFVLVRIDGEKQPQLMRRFRVNGFPTVIIFDSAGNEVDRIAGYLEPESMARALASAHANTRQTVQFQNQLARNPESARWNLAAGVYYFENGKAELALSHFMRARRSPDDDTPTKRDALFNAAVACMELVRYGEAVQHWNQFISEFPDAEADLEFARFYRGLSLYYDGNRRAAVPDLRYAVEHMNGSNRETAQRLLASALATRSQ